MKTFPSRDAAEACGYQSLTVPIQDGRKKLEGVKIVGNSKCFYVAASVKKTNVTTIRRALEDAEIVESIMASLATCDSAYVYDDDCFEFFRHSSEILDTYHD